MIEYIVKKKDTLSKIARNFGVTTSAIVKVNKIKNKNIIRVGQKLQIPTTENIVVTIDEIVDEKFAQLEALPDFTNWTFYISAVLAGYIAYRIGKRR